jgi:DNA-binding transcriptional MerR regulator
MRIGELAEQAGISTKAIRYYEQIGILTSPARTASGYRAYDQSALGRLSFVRAAQALGLTLGEIRQIIAFRNDGITPVATSPTCCSAAPPSSAPASPSSSDSRVSFASSPSGPPPWMPGGARRSASATSSPDGPPAASPPRARARPQQRHLVQRYRPHRRHLRRLHPAEGMGLGQELHQPARLDQTDQLGEPGPGSGGLPLAQPASPGGPRGRWWR